MAIPSSPIAMTPPVRSRTTRSRPTLVGFFGAAALLSAAAFLPQVWASYRGAAAVPAPVRMLQLLLFFGPGALALVWAAREGGGRAIRELLAGLVRWRVSPWWYVAVLLGPLAANLLALLATGHLGGSAVVGRAPLATLQAFATALVGYLLLNTEELAWRGYAWPRMRARLGAARAAVLLGVVWGLLHAPLFLVRGGHPGGWPPALFLVMAAAFSVILALVYEGTGGSVLLAHLLHQSLNAWGDTVRTYPRVTGSIAPSAVLVLLAVLVAVLGVRRAGWRWERPGERPRVTAPAAA